MIIDCKKDFTNGKFSCKNGYRGPENGLPIKTVPYTILMHLEHQYCNMGCKYCVCDTSNIDPKYLYGKYGSDYPKMLQLIKQTDEIRGTLNHHHRFEIFGGEPLYNLQAFKEIVEVLKQAYPTASFSTSTNGLVLANKQIVDYLIDNHIHFQLSHDGLGEKYRANGIDPLENQTIYSNVKLLAQKGLLTTINCTLSQVNYSLLDNIKFWNSKLDDWGTPNISIKLNHPYNADYNIDFAFTDPIITARYFEEYAIVYTFMKCNDEVLKPYRKYILEEVERDTKKGKCNAVCPSFQNYNRGNPSKQTWSFTITTVGTYGECILAERVENPGGAQPHYCDECIYKDYSGCKSCGSLNYPKACLYNKMKMDLFTTLTNK
jgi:sulfatase maturation enzyme AslB (radical SAM superfamily)